ncbi:MAG: bifunctional indole-3-glycerol-phosphate synthase TrpC/phosphoribosylanthranilate isomerase TrpF [Idiomarina sp.]|nr:bifunctional indole-3-glycerol-phosphate synthase TrpC/phosphoribosylanthranilate isomerase TrpF [Idiomarina sp.]
MSEVLAAIVAQRKTRLAELEQQLPSTVVMAHAKALVGARPHRSLAAHVRAGNPGFILECKKASPSKGLIRADFDPVAIAKTYQPYAAAISVLTEPDYFQGSFAYLQAVSQQVQVPVLCKDFIFSEYQVALARYYGADAILLMLSVVSDTEYQRLALLAEALELEILTEVSDEAEMKRAAALGAKIIGINHRDLRDLSIDLQRSEALAPLAPKDALLIAESGLSEHRTIRELARTVDGFLIGSHLTGQTSIDQACRQLIFGEHKVCGLTHPDDAITAAASGALYGGLIFAKRSPRAVDRTQAAIIQEAASLRYVGVFTADESLEDILRLQRELNLHAVQLHDFDPNDSATRERLLQLKEALPPKVGVWFAFSMTEQLEHLPELPVDRFVLDHGAGGTGKTFDWSVIPTHGREQCLLAGGIGPDQVAEALQLGCLGLDMNSKLESQRAQKDPAKISLAMTRIRQYGRNRRSDQEHLS